MRAVQVSQFLAIPRLTAGTACWLSTKSTISMSSHKNSCSKFCTGSPTCLNPSMRASTSFSAVQHEVADYPENFHARGKHTARLRVPSFKCNPLTLRVVQASPFHSASVESSSYRSSQVQPSQRTIVKASAKLVINWQRARQIRSHVLRNVEDGLVHGQHTKHHL